MPTIPPLSQLRRVSRHLIARQQQTPTPAQTQSASTIVGVAVIGSVVLILLVVLAVCATQRKIKSSKTSNASKTKGGFLGRITRWRSGSNRGEYSDHLQPSVTTQSANSGDDLSRERSTSRTGEVEMELAQNVAGAGQAQNSSESRNESTVDRHASVRSIMTLPAYSVSAHPTEQVIGREGERGGVDVVLEHPETVNEEEERRDEEMESLYQIRQARRQEAADREERRRQRREARARGDNATLARLQAESRQRAEAASEGTLLSAQLIAEHQTKNRDRRVSAVQYFDVGVARHDGSRVRATSIDSDNRPLLSSAASISGGLSTHHPGRSATSVRSSVSSVASAGSGDIAGGDFEVISLDGRSRSPSIAPSTEPNPPQASVEQPPHYENLAWGDAPPYESPVLAQGQAPQLPSIIPVPAIEITAALSPADSVRRPEPRSSNQS